MTSILHILLAAILACARGVSLLSAARVAWQQWRST